LPLFSVKPPARLAVFTSFVIESTKYLSSSDSRFLVELSSCTFVSSVNLKLELIKQTFAKTVEAFRNVIVRS